MVNFKQLQASRLFEGDSNLVGAGWWGFQAVAQVPLKDMVSLETALMDTTLDGTFIYTAIAPDFNTQSITDFITAIDGILANLFGTRAIIWLPDGNPALIHATLAQAVPLTMSGGKVKTNTGLTVSLTGVDGVAAQLSAGAELSMDPMDSFGDTILCSSSSSPVMTLGGSEAPQVFQPENNAHLHFKGNNLGTFTFPLFIVRQSLQVNLNWGFQVLIPDTEKNTNAKKRLTDTILYHTAFLPFATDRDPNPTDALGFHAQINMINPNNVLKASATAFWYTGKNSPGGAETDTSLVSYYRTNYGKRITLYPVSENTNGQQPAAMVFNPGYLKTPLQNGFRFAPLGDFIMAVEDTNTSCQYLMGGLSGPETITFAPATENNKSTGYRLRFTINQAAFVPQFPLENASPVGPPIDPTALLMNADHEFRTSWATVIAPPAATTTASYQAAPQGADLFGKDELINGSVTGLLGPKNPGQPLPVAAGFSFPLFPMAGYIGGNGVQDMTKEQMELLNRQIIGPTRRNVINLGTLSTLSTSRLSTLPTPCGESETVPINVTTPTGNIITVDKGTWQALLLAQVTFLNSTTVARQMGFTRLDTQLQAAFQTDNLFLVAANPVFLGSPADGVFLPPAAPVIPDSCRFYNTINIEDWKFTASVGQKNNYNDYRNVFIMKGITGKLTDLVLSPDKWTQKDIFAAPATLNPDGSVGTPDISQLITLSNWLNQYLQDALAKGDSPYFQDFARIIQDEQWMGVLFLKVDITGIPKDLAGIAAGVADPNNFYAHHLGIEISQIKGDGVVQTDSSSLFGLVYYVDPDYDDKTLPHAIAPKDLGVTYDFTLLSLKALFKNTRVAKFESLAQLVLNKVYGSDVDKLTVLDKNGNLKEGNIYNAILLLGAYQLNGNTPVYSLAATETNRYSMRNNILTDVVVETANMSTRDDGSISGTVVSWIAMAGYMTFAVLKDASGSITPLPDFDIFSFGTDAGGLSFSNLGLRIEIPGGDAAQQILVMSEAEITFNTSASQARQYSLFPNFQMELQGLSNGNLDNAPAGLGYATVATAYGLLGVAGRNWHGLVFKLNMGTPGALASKINLSSALLLAWADDSGNGADNTGYQALVGLQLPGAGAGGELFSLQTVIKLSVGIMRLDYNAEKKSFLLLLNEIALKFLGLLKIPPNGSSSFFLFGNPAAKSSTGLGWYGIYNQDQKQPDCKKTTPLSGATEVKYV